MLDPRQESPKLAEEIRPKGGDREERGWVMLAPAGDLPC